MKKVGVVLEEIDKLDEQYKLINNAVNKMLGDEEIKKFMFQKVGIDIKSLQDVATTLLIRRQNLKDILNEILVDIR